MVIAAGQWVIWCQAIVALVAACLGAGPDSRPVAEQAEKEANRTAPGVDVAGQFLRLAIAGNDANALKLVVPGTVSENKVAEIRRAGYSRPEFVLVLINDTRVEAVTKEKRARKPGEPEGHLVIMVVKGKDGAWRVKDLDVRNDDELKPRIALYLSGRYNEKPAGK